MHKKTFTKQCALNCTGAIQAAAKVALELNKTEIFVQEMLDQDSDDGSRSGTRRALGDFLYANLQLFKDLSYYDRVLIRITSKRISFLERKIKNCKYFFDRSTRLKTANKWDRHLAASYRELQTVSDCLTKIIQDIELKY